jgi:rfaE bifunctional protein kinase chain/domain
VSDPSHRRDGVISEILRRVGPEKRIVFVSGNFNTVHPGHLRLLRFAAECGDFLLVGVNANETPGVLVPDELRLDGVQSVSFVDYAFVVSFPVDGFIRELAPSVVCKGKEHEARFNPEHDAVNSYGGKLLFSSGEMRFSSVDLLTREMVESHLPSIARATGFSEVHGFTMRSLRDMIDRWSGLRVTVLGDLIVDEYIICDALGMSQEDPALVVSPVEEESFLGGAGIVASHASRLGAEVRYFTVVGDDAPASFARDMLRDYGVDVTLRVDTSRPTTLKQRYRAAGHTLLRVSRLRQHDIDQQLLDELFIAVKGALLDTDLLIFSDFNYGSLPQGLVDAVTEECTRRRIPMVADSQSSSQVGDVSRFKGMMLLTPTEREARLAVRDFRSGLVVLAEKLRKKSHAETIIMTLGNEGSMGHAASAESDEWLTDRLPAMSTAPRDPAGAGDSLLTCAAMAMAVGADIWQSMYLGSVAAACQVSRVGNTPLSPEEILIELAD